MSSISRWTYVVQATVWPAGAKDHLNGGIVWGAPYIIMCDFIENDGQSLAGARSSINGAEFIPQCDYYHEDPRPDMGDRICLGDMTAIANPTSVTGLTEVVKANTRWNMKAFGADELPDYRTTV